MSTHEFHDDPEQLALSQAARYELRDGNFWSVGKWITGFFVFSAISFGIAYLMLIGIGSTVVRGSHPINTTVLTLPRQMPLKTPLQNNITAARDMEELRAKEREVSENYGPSESNPKVMRIPVDEAIEKLASKGTQGVTGQ